VHGLSLSTSRILRQMCVILPQNALSFLTVRQDLVVSELTIDDDE
jgi:hypothetical protein